MAGTTSPLAFVRPLPVTLKRWYIYVHDREGWPHGFDIRRRFIAPDKDAAHELAKQYFATDKQLAAMSKSDRRFFIAEGEHFTVSEMRF